jgi:hypothetical protein
MLYDNQASYTPDMAAEIDKEWEVLADEWGISIETALEIIRWRDNAIREHQAMVLGQFIALLLTCSNQPVVVHAFALAAGLDQLNEIKTETEVAERFGVSRALVSHYTVAARDVLSGKHGDFDVTKFRKRNETREVYREKATDPFLEKKREIKMMRGECPNEAFDFDEMLANIGDADSRDKEIQITSRKNLNQ